MGILTGPRFCDIKYLTWNQVRGEQDNYYLQFRQRKTYKPQHIYIFNQTFDLLGQQGEATALVFCRINYNYARDFLKLWPQQLVLISTLPQLFRHTYAT